jgi:hypothetical protein
MAASCIYDLLRNRELNPVTVTGAFGGFCLLSLRCPRPVMFYFSRYFIVGKDPQGRAAFEARAQKPIFRRGIQLVTAIWGVLWNIRPLSVLFRAPLTLYISIDYGRGAMLAGLDRGGVCTSVFAADMMSRRYCRMAVESP